MVFKALCLLMLACCCLAVSLANVWGSEGGPPAAPPLAPEKQAEMKEIRLMETQDGEKKWLLKADHADYVRDRDRIVLTRVWVEIYGPAGDTMVISSDAGSIGVKTRDLQLAGNVRARTADYEFTGPEVHYDPQSRILTAPGPVKLEGPRILVEGQDLTVDLKNHKLALARHQQTRMRLAGGLWNF